MTLLDVVDLRVQFRTREGVVRAVDGVSFSMREGETVGLVGESGSGKSVTALTMMKLLPAFGAEVTGGQVMLEGRDLMAMGEGQLEHIRGAVVSMIFQDPMTSLNPVMSVGDQIREAISAHRSMSRGSARKHAVELLDLVGIPRPADRYSDYPHQFSGGMRQRVMIAMAVSCSPKLLLADEPTTALDVTVQAQILDLLKSLALGSQTATLLITHDLGVVAGMTQRVLVMYAGKIVERAETRELFAAPRMPYTWGLLRSLPRLDDESGSRLVPIEGAPPSLIGDLGGCRFAPRCQYRRSICENSEPSLINAAGASPGHEVRCWGTQDVPGGGWLIGAAR